MHHCREERSARHQAQQAHPAHHRWVVSCVMCHVSRHHVVLLSRVTCHNALLRSLSTCYHAVLLSYVTCTYDVSPWLHACFAHPLHVHGYYSFLV